MELKREPSAVTSANRARSEIEARRAAASNARARTKAGPIGPPPPPPPPPEPPPPEGAALTVSVADDEVVLLPPRVMTQRNPSPFIAAVTPLTVSVAAVLPL